VNDQIYRPRIIDSVIDKRLKSAGAVLITGPKWCGKSTTGLFHTRSSASMDVPETREQYRLAPSLVLDGEYPRLIDEWQDTPDIWDRVRRRIDESRQKGLYVFTGSATPATEPSHTGTGRFSRVPMRTMSLFELGESSGTVSLKSLFNGGQLTPQASGLDYYKTVRLVCRGGWPGILDMDDESALAVSKDYIETIALSDISRVDGMPRDPGKVRLLLRSLARTVTTSAKVSTIRADIFSGIDDDEGVSERSIHSYLTALKRIFVLYEQAAWTESLRSKARIRTMPLRHLADPSLAVAAISATPAMLLHDTETMGLFFESLCVRDLDVYVQALGGRVCYYRDESGFEVDAIVQLDDGRWGAVEVKMGIHQFDEAAANLLRLKDRMREALPPPSFLMILNATAGFSATREDGVLIVPLDLLGP
jgi:predicted AAA+ superfamily ATPase